MDFNYQINPLPSPSVGAPALKYRYVNTETTSPGEVKGLMDILDGIFKKTIEEAATQKKMVYFLNPNSYFIKHQ